MFTHAGFNGRHYDTGIRGWTRHIEGTRFRLAKLICFEGGDYAWHGHRFIAWGEQCVLGSRAEFDLPDEWQHGLEQCALVDRPYHGKVKFVIYGETASKANSRKLVTMNRYSPKARGMVKMPALIKSEKARNYERDALVQIPPKARVRFEGPVRVTLRIFYASERPDLDESVVLDVMQDRFVKQGEGEDAVRILVQKGVYRNDRQVKEKHVYWGKDKALPRAEIEVEPLVDQGDLLEAAA